MNCAYHTKNPAVVQCGHCARPLCPACDHRIRGFPFCQDCIVAGVEMLNYQRSRSPDAFVIRRKTSPFVATLLSLFVPGLGAAYNGQTSKALVHFAIFASFFQMAVVTDGVTFFVLGVIGTWLFAAVDACRTAQLTRAGLAPDAEEDAIARQLSGNPVAWGVILVALGSLFLARTMLPVQFPVRKMLPVVLVVLGAYILFFDTNSPPASVVSSWPQTSARFGTGEFPTHVRQRKIGSARFK